MQRWTSFNEKCRVILGIFHGRQFQVVLKRYSNSSKNVKIRYFQRIWKFPIERSDFLFQFQNTPECMLQFRFFGTNIHPWNGCSTPWNIGYIPPFWPNKLVTDTKLVIRIRWQPWISDNLAWGHQKLFRPLNLIWRPLFSWISLSRTSRSSLFFTGCPEAVTQPFFWGKREVRSHCQKKPWARSEYCFVQISNIYCLIFLSTLPPLCTHLPALHPLCDTADEELGVGVDEQLGSPCSHCLPDCHDARLDLSYIVRLPEKSKVFRNAIMGSGESFAFCAHLSPVARLL